MMSIICIFTRSLDFIRRVILFRWESFLETNEWDYYVEEGIVGDR